MDENRNDEVAQCPRARAEWVHELRNAVNTAGVTVALARRMAEKGDTAGSLEMIAMAESAWGRCRDLLLLASKATAMPSGGEFVRPPGEGAQEHRALQQRR